MKDKVDKLPEAKKYDFPASASGGVKPLSIRGLFEDERYRLSEEFTDEERAWRKQWFKDQVLAPNEPRPASKEWIKETRNPIRRFLSYPWQALENKMTPVLGTEFSTRFRFMVPKLIVGIMGTYLIWYHLKYNQNDWTSAHGPSVFISKPVVLPGDPDCPLKQDRFQPCDYDDRGFKSRKVFLD